MSENGFKDCCWVQHPILPKKTKCKHIPSVEHDLDMFFRICLCFKNESMTTFWKIRTWFLGRRWKSKRNCSHESMSIVCGSFKGSPRSRHFDIIWSNYHFDCREIITTKLFKHMEKMDIGQKCQLRTQHNGQFVINENERSKPYHTHSHKLLHSHKLYIN